MTEDEGRMATWTGQSIESSSRASWSWSLPPKPWAFLGMALAFGYVPHLISYSDNLMQREHYQFFPLAWLGAVALVCIRREALRSRGEVAVTFVGWAGVWLGALLLAVAGILNSSWLAMVSVLPVASGLAWLNGGGAAVRTIAPGLVMFATTLRPPGALDALLIRDLRSLTVRISSRILDAMEIIHVPTGNVLRVPGGDLLVDEACSGVNSLVSIGAVVLFVGLLLRRRPLHLALLLAWAAGIVVLANVARVSIVTIAYARWQVDLLRGWKHEALGVALYAVSLGLVASLDRLVLLLASMAPRRSKRLGRDHVPLPSEHPVSPRPSPVAATSQGRLAGPRSLHLAISASAILAIALIFPIRWAQGFLAFESGKSGTAHLVKRAKEILTEESMPAELAGWRRVGFRTDERGRDSVLGQYSSSWQYRLGSRTALISMDYPFVGWHELTSCYVSIGWTPQKRIMLRGSSSDGSGPASVYVAASLNNRKGEFGHLIFGLVDDHARWIQPPVDRGMWLAGREIDWKAAPALPGYQFQVFSTGFRPHNDEEQQQATRLFEAACREFRRQLFVPGATQP